VQSFIWHGAFLGPTRCPPPAPPLASPFPIVSKRWAPFSSPAGFWHSEPKERGGRPYWSHRQFLQRQGLASTATLQINSYRRNEKAASGRQGPRRLVGRLQLQPRGAGMRQGRGLNFIHRVAFPRCRSRSKNDGRSKRVSSGGKTAARLAAAAGVGHGRPGAAPDPSAAYSINKALRNEDAAPARLPGRHQG